MPRRGWTSMDVPNGWVQVLRGPQLKSEVARGIIRSQATDIQQARADLSTAC